MSAAEVAQLLDGFGPAPDAAESLAAQLHEYVERMTAEQLAAMEPRSSLVGDTTPAEQVGSVISHGTFVPKSSDIGAVTFGGGH